MSATPLQWLAAGLFAAALIHTFAAKGFERLAHRHPRHAGALHLLGEVEVVFGFWAAVLIVAMALLSGSAEAIAYAESRQYTEPLFVFTVMVIAATKPVMASVAGLMTVAGKGLPLPAALAQVWLGLAAVPLLGSLVTEPAAMTLAALMLRPRLFTPEMPEWRKYAALGVLFVNVSIGGTLTSYAAPPVLMVASAWQWDSLFMLQTFGWKAVIAVLINASLLTWWLRAHLMTHATAWAGGAGAAGPGSDTKVDTEVDNKVAINVNTPGDRGHHAAPVPWLVQAVHLAFLAGVVVFAHHPVIFLGLFLFFMGYTQAYAQHQSPLLLKEGLLVGFFLAGLVVLGGLQQWWLQPLVASLSPLALFFGALGLTALTDNAALTYLGTLIEGISAPSQYMLVAGAVAGGGLTVIANAPNPAGAALLRGGFADQSIGALGLLAGAALPTAVAAAAFLLL